MLRSFLCPLLIASAALPGQPPQVLARVNGVPVGAAGASFLVREMKREGLPVALSSLGQELITLEALRQMASARGLDRRAPVLVRQAFAEEDALAAVCRDQLRKEVPAYSGAEREALWSWVRAHALTQHELHRIEFETLEEARRYQGPRGGTPGRDLDWLRPFWALPQDPELSAGEARLLDQMIASGKACYSAPYRRNGQYRVLVFSARSRKVDPLLLQELGGDPEPDAQRLQALAPEHHLRRTLERLRAAAKLPALPAPEIPLPEARRNGLDGEARQLFAQEGRRRGLDREFSGGLAVARAWALAQSLLEEDLLERPITEAELREACLREGVAPAAVQFESRSFPSREAARAALKSLHAKSPGAPGGEAPWVPAESLPPRTADALRRLATGAWTEEPVRSEGESFLLLRLVGLRPEPGFEAALERRRDALLGQLRQRRWYELGARARQQAKIQRN